MAKAITNPGLAADKLVLDAIKTLVATYQQTKTAGDYGVVDWAKAERLIAKSAIRKILRGNSGFRGDIVLGSNP